MQRVSKATRHGDMSSTGDAANKLIRQFNFPFEYRNDEEIIQADHDRFLIWDRDHASAAFQRHMKTGELGIGWWAQRVSDEKVMALLKVLFKVNKDYPKVKWTGYRITGTVNRSNGGPIYSMWLFAKKSGSKTKVYSDSTAPNVVRGGDAWQIATGLYPLNGE